MAGVFLSYDRRDSETARAVAAAIGRAGYAVWWDQDIKGGAQFGKEIEQALADADAVVVLCSQHSLESAWVRDEAAAGRDSGRLVPATIDSSAPPLGFRQYQTIDLSGRKLHANSKSFRALRDAINSVVSVPGSAQIVPLPAPSPDFAFPRPSRRNVVAGVLAVVAVGAGAGLLLRGREEGNSPELEAVFAQAWQAWTQGTTEGTNQAIGLFRRATVINPDNADAWGLLGCALADHASYFAAASERSAFRERSLEAGRRALSIDRKNAYGRTAVAYARPVMGNWLLMEREFRQAMADQPEKWLIPYSLALLLSHVGRMSEAADYFDKLRDNPPTANQYFFHTQALWGSGQVERAERLLEEAESVYRTHASIWQARFDMLLFGGRADAALALVQNEASWPTGMSAEAAAIRTAVAGAVTSRDATQISAANSKLLEQARHSVWAAVRSIQYCCALGLAENAFAITEAYYFSKGFPVPDEEAIAGRSSDVSLTERQTMFLFLPSTRLLRSHQRFTSLVERIGLTDYWQKSGSTPDYRKS